MSPSKLSLYLKIAGAVVAVLVIYTFYQLMTTGTVDVDMAPSDGQISLNNKVLRPGKHRVHTGSYQLHFMRKGFGSISQDISVSRGSYQYRAEALAPSDPAYATWYIDHPADQKKAESISSKFFDTATQTALKNLPILKKLPYVNLTPYFKVDYGPSKKHPHSPDKLALYVYPNTDIAKKAAQDWIRQNGADPTKIEIIYPNFVK